MKKLLLLFCLCGLVFTGYAQSLSTSVNGLSFCAGATVQVSYSDGVTTFQTGNVFTVQLSDAAGSFASPADIGQLPGTAASGTIAAVLPAVTGSGYRIRVVASDPAVIGSDNGADITINPMPVVLVTPPAVTLCSGQSVNLTASGAASYSWFATNSVISPATGPVVSVTPTGPDVVTVIGTSVNGCSNVAGVTLEQDNFQVVFSETMGNTPVVAPIIIAAHENSNSFDNDQLLMTGAVASSNPAVGTQIRTANPSAGYPGASGGNNVFLNFNNVAIPSHFFQIEDINTLGMNNLMLSFGLKKQSPSSNGSQLIVEYSADGINYTPLPYQLLPTGAGTQDPWYLIDSVQGLPAAQNLRIRWRQTANNMSFQIDDVKLRNVVPQPTISPAGPILSGNCVTLTASAAAQYSWSGPGVTPGSATSQFLMVCQSGLYSVTVWDANGCMNTSAPTQVTITNSPFPPPVATNNAPVCVGSPVQLSASGADPGTVYTWTGPGISGSQTGAGITVNPTAAGSYIYTVTITSQAFPGSPPLSDTTLVQILPTDNAAFTYGSGTFCQSGNIPVPVTAPGVSGTFTAMPVGLVIDAATGVIDVGASSVGCYTVTFTTAGSCQSATSQSVCITNAPSAGFQYPAASYCQSAPDPAPVFVTGASGGVFSANSSGMVISPMTGVVDLSASAPGVYTIYNTIPASGGCAFAIDSTQITISQTPATPVVSNNGPVCVGTTLQITAAGSSVTGTYLWTMPNGTAYTGTGAGTSVITLPAATLSQNGTWTVTVSEPGCTSLPAITNVIVNAIPAPPTIFSNTPICVGQTLELSTMLIPGASYTWTAPNGNTLIGQTVYVSPVQLSDSGPYTLTAANYNGCGSMPATTYVIIEPLPAPPVVSSNSPVCEGSTLQFSASSIPGVSYNWVGPNGFYTALQNPTRLNAQPSYSGIYTAYATLNGCSSLAALLQAEVVNNLPITITSNQPVCPGQTLTLSASSASASQYTWSGPDNFSFTGAVVPVPAFTAAGYGTYSVWSDDVTCDYEGSIAITGPAEAIITGITSYCTGNTITLNATGGAGVTGFSWSGPNGFTSSQQTISIPNADASNAGLYAVTALYAVCNASPVSVQVAVTAPPVIMALATTPVNQGSTIFFAVDGPAGAYIWSGPNGFAATGMFPYLQNALPVNSGSYTVTPAGCVAAASVVQVQINGLSQITGVVYNDANNNGIQDAGEMPKPGVVVWMQPGNYYAISSSTGAYSFYTFPGSFTISIQPQYSIQTISPAQYMVVVPAGSGMLFSNNNFGIHTPPLQNIVASMYTSGGAVPGFSSYHFLHYQNSGTIPVSGQVKYIPDPLFVLNASLTTPGYTISGDTLIWTYTNLQPGYNASSIVYRGTVPVGTPLGTLLTSKLIITPIAGDIAPGNNTYILQQTVTGSWDPNDKQVLPLGNITPAQVANGQELTYTIRFQNTGTAPAVNVLLVDTITEHLNLGTLQMLNSSHDYELHIRDGRVLEWKFANIMLPDSNANEPESHGFVQYRIKPVSTLALGDEIKNTAYIYFDFNEAVVTNTTSTMVGLVAAPEEIEITSLQLFPNPNTGKFTLKLTDCAPGKLQIRIVNLLGQQVYGEAASANSTAFEQQLNVQDLAEGMFLLQVRQGDKVLTKRMVIQK